MASEGLNAYREVEKLQRQTQFGIVMRAQKQRIGLAMILKAIETTPTGRADRPVTPVKMIKVTVA